MSHFIYMPALPEIILAILLCVILVVSVYIQEAKRFGFALHAVMLAFIITMMAILMNDWQDQALALNDLFVIDSFGNIFKLMVLLGALATLFMGQDVLKRENFAHFEYPILAGFATLGMMMMLSAHDLMALYIGLELQSLSLYVMASFKRDSLRASEAGLKYFVLGALASGLLLYGSSLIYGFMGSTDFSVLATILAASDFSNLDFGDQNIGVIIGLVFVLVALAFKISATPFHMWTPDVYEGSPTPVTAFFAAAPKIAAIGLLLRFVMEPFGDMIASWQQIIIALSALSMLLGAFAGLVQRNIKRLMAYSSIGHVGFALMGMAAGGMDAVTSVTVYLGIYLASTLGVFGCLLAMTRDGESVEAIDDLSGLHHNRPMMAFVMMIFMFSMAGIPPLAGFFAKWYVFVAAIDAGFVYLAIIGALASVVSAYYYLRIIKVIYFDQAETPLDTQYGLNSRIIMTVSALLLVGYVFYPAMLGIPAQIAARGLF